MLVESKIGAMLNKSAANNVGKILYLGLPAVSLLVTGFASYDPVNVGKMVLAVGVGFALFALAFRYGFKYLLSNYKTPTLAAFFFGLAGLVTSFFSSAPFVQNLFGVFGRNTGLLTYLGLIGIFIGTLLIIEKDSFTRIIKALLVAGVLNVFFCGLELSGTNVFGFNNIYGEILGTFGNPNFISSFLGIFTSVLICFYIGGKYSWIVKFIVLLVATAAFYEVYKSKSIQGIVVIALGLAYFGYLIVRAYFKSIAYQAVYILGAVTAAVFAIAGALQVGPLTSLIYKGSVSLRGEYWKAGIRAALDHPFTGVGFDTYGDWYRRTRSARAMIVPGPDVITNSAHNVNIDIFSYGGFLVLMPYLILLICAAVAVVRFISRTKTYDPLFAALSVAWLCYQAQAIISINQIGLAVWGWALTGLVIAYEKVTRTSRPQEVSQKPRDKRNSKSDASATVYLIGTAGFALGIVIASPPFLADAGWRNAMKAGNAEQVVAAANRWPLDSYRLANISIALAQNKFEAQGLEIARKGAVFNPDYFDSWKVIAGIPGSTSEEKKKAIEEMKRLDPRNNSIK